MERVRPMQSAGVERQKTTKTTWLANLPLCGWAVSVALGCLHYHFDVFAPYREINGFPKDRVEDYCL